MRFFCSYLVLYCCISVIDWTEIVTQGWSRDLTEVGYHFCTPGAGKAK